MRVAWNRLGTWSRTVISYPSRVGVVAFTVLLLEATTTWDRAGSIVKPLRPVAIHWNTMQVMRYTGIERFPVLEDINLQGSAKLARSVLPSTVYTCATQFYKFMTYRIPVDKLFFD